MKYKITDPKGLRLIEKEDGRWLLKFNGFLTQLNYSGAQFLNIAMEHNDVESAVSAISLIFPEPPDIIRKHFVDFILKIEQLGLCRIIKPGQ